MPLSFLDGYIAQKCGPYFVIRIEKKDEDMGSLQYVEENDLQALNDVHDNLEIKKNLRSVSIKVPKTTVNNFFHRKWQDQSTGSPLYVIMTLWLCKPLE